MNKAHRPALHLSIKNQFHSKQSSTVNPFGIKLLNKDISQELFTYRRHEDDSRLINKALEQLKSFKIKTSSGGLDEAVGLEERYKLPDLVGSNVDEHFRAIGSRYIEPYHHLLLEMLEHGPLPQPNRWVLDQTGWTRYDKSGGAPQVYGHLRCFLLCLSKISSALLANQETFDTSVLLIKKSYMLEKGPQPISTIDHTWLLT